MWTVINDGTENAQFFIGDAEVTKTEWEEYDAQFSDEEATYYEVTVKNIEKYITEEYIRDTK